MERAPAPSVMRFLSHLDQVMLPVVFPVPEYILAMLFLAMQIIQLLS